MIPAQFIRKSCIRCLLCLFIVLQFRCTTDDAPHPNILFIAIDDLRPELGCYGNDLIHSPNLDRLAAEGAVFRHHYVQVPTCGPSRHALLTGLRPRKASELSNNVTRCYLFPGQPEVASPNTFIHHLRRNGYYTVGIGKISHSADGMVYGYEEQPGNKRELPYSWNKLIFDSGKWGTGWNAFFGYADGENRQSKQKICTPYESAEVADEGYPDGLTAQLAIEHLDQLKTQKTPFFLGVGFFKPHLPFNAPKQYWDLYERDSIPLPGIRTLPRNVHPSSLHESGEFNQYKLTDEKASLSQAVSEEYARKLRHAYFASVSYIDAQVGRVLSALKKNGLDKNTIIVVWGDHGWHLGEHNVWGKHTLFDVALRSTLIIKAEGKITAGLNIPSVVETVDIYPSLMELAGLSMPHEVDGASFLPLLNDNSANQSEAAYSYFRKGVSMRTSRYRLTRYFRDEMPSVELYDHQNDPFETVNIAAENPQIVESLMPLLDEGNTGLFE